MKTRFAPWIARAAAAPRLSILLSLALCACSNPRRVEERTPPAAAPVAAPAPVAAQAAAAPTVPAGMAQATFAGGCFWCMEPPFEKLPGVVSVISGYSGGHKDNPSYDEVSAGVTGHAEAVQITYDPAKVTYQRLLDVFWHNIDPTSPDAQFCDHGTQYRSAIFFHDAEQQQQAQASLRAIAESKRLPAPIVTQLEPLKRFYPAEDYHQDFYKKNPGRYTSYRTGCGRDRRLQELWGVSPAH